MIDYHFEEESIASWIELSRREVERCPCDTCTVLYAHLIASFRCLKKANTRIRAMESLLSEKEVSKIVKTRGCYENHTINLGPDNHTSTTVGGDRKH